MSALGPASTQNAQLKAEDREVQELQENLYQVQAELARRQTALENHHRASALAASERQQADERLEAVKKQYSSAAAEVEQARIQGEALQHRTVRYPCPWA